MTHGKEMIGITAFGGYVPRLRLNRQAVVDANAVRLHRAMNPNFFKGTVVEHDAAKLLSST